MTILRIHKKTKNFLILDKTCLNTVNLSWGAKGLHAYLMSLPNDWRVNVANLTQQAANGRDAVRGLLNELKKAGYITTSWSRHEASGKYNSLEYIVHELPQIINDPADTQVPEPDLPYTDFQAPVNPSPASLAPEKPSLISINNTKDLNNKVITAAKEANSQTSIDKKAAAVLPFKNTSNLLTPSDSIIGEKLTSNQIKMINAFIQKLDDQISINDPALLREEVHYCILNSQHFTACKKDFAKKLNAIRTVIMRGEWQTPSEMILAKQQEKDSTTEKLQRELNEAMAESNHFQKLLQIAPPKNKQTFEDIIEKSQVKIKQLEEKIQQGGRNEKI